MKMIRRRDAVKGMVATGLGAALGSSMLPGLSQAASNPGGGPNRVIFFLQNHGFDPRTCIPEGMTSSGSLAKATLPEPIEALQPYPAPRDNVDN